jgi:hypothetical protein
MGKKVLLLLLLLLVSHPDHAVLRQELLYLSHLHGHAMYFV